MAEDGLWFFGSDVLTVLFGQASGKSNAYGKLDDAERTKVNRISLGLAPGKPMVLITESDLYKLVLRPDKPEAKDFQNWVTKVVLPSIRKDGGYVMGSKKLVTGDMTTDEFMARALVRDLKGGVNRPGLLAHLGPL